jgi:hypothetical protein
MYVVSGGKVNVDFVSGETMEPELSSLWIASAKGAPFGLFGCTALPLQDGERARSVKVTSTPIRCAQESM